MFNHWQVYFGKDGCAKLTSLTSNIKVVEKNPNFSVGDLVLVVDKDVQRGRWPKGLIEEVFPDTEGIVRRVTVRRVTTNVTQNC